MYVCIYIYIYIYIYSIILYYAYTCYTDRSIHRSEMRKTGPYCRHSLSFGSLGYAVLALLWRPRAVLRLPCLASLGSLCGASPRFAALVFALQGMAPSGPFHIGRVRYLGIDAASILRAPTPLAPGSARATTFCYGLVRYRNRFLRSTPNLPTNIIPTKTF